MDDGEAQLQRARQEGRGADRRLLARRDMLRPSAFEESKLTAGELFSLKIERQAQAAAINRDSRAQNDDDPGVDPINPRSPAAFSVLIARLWAKQESYGIDPYHSRALELLALNLLRDHGTSSASGSIWAGRASQLLSDQAVRGDRKQAWGTLVANILFNCDSAFSFARDKPLKPWTRTEERDAQYLHDIDIEVFNAKLDGTYK
jgi:hypothetical protein